ncbi:trifunctional serine/threonine-protein kinase/ATP-binding protein/sensor histidine kinase [Cupriavidus agavae]|uniref:histidine kinase n=1 Tax=Cupriavidus agavae TaxID=1001822 RepID=A0A4Q7R8U6_9BURK|nr:AAA family ATPase [Cupriavidus agavae]RZT29264.1 PAS domain S-box-containing protein [Cupriavidus agavae]
MREKTPSAANSFSLADYSLVPICQDGIVALSRGLPPDGEDTILLAHAASDQAESTAARLLENEFELRPLLRASWAIVPRQLARVHGGMFAVYDDDAGQPLGVRSDVPKSFERVLSIAVKASVALKAAHESGLVHRSITPFTLFVDDDEHCRISNFGFAQRQTQDADRLQQQVVLRPDVLPYISPEHTGRTRHPIDTRSDLYSLGVVFYQLLTGQLPFKVSQGAAPSEWLHSHVARAPASPNTLDATIPEALSAIVLKLLDKSPALRYQSAAGLEADLKRCEAEWAGKGLIGFFQLGDADHPAELVLATGVFGRDAEMEQLLAALADARALQRPVLVTLTGQSGVGKSALLHAFLAQVADEDIPVALGKAEQFRSDMPYAPIAEAVRTHVHQILGLDDEQLASWRARLKHALGTFGKVACRIAPSIGLLVDEFPAPASDAADDAQVETAMHRLIGVFSRPGQPFVLVLDDYQWVDQATHRLVQGLLARSESFPVLVVCTAREEALEGLAGRQLEALRKAASTSTAISLPPLDLAVLTRILAETLRDTPQGVQPLAQVIQIKTAGNPFFVSQFLRMLADCRLMRVSADGKWQYDIDAIDAHEITENVAELVLQRLARLPDSTSEMLARMACLGRGTELWLLGELFSLSERALHAALSPARSLGIVSLSDDSYSFTHDRVQEAASALLGPDSRARTCLRAGKLLAGSLPADEADRPDDLLFRTAGWLAQGLECVTATSEIIDVARIFLSASARARRSAALANAQVYVEHGLALLDRLPASHTGRADLLFALQLEYAAALLHQGQLDAALAIVNAQIEDSATRLQAAGAHLLKIEIHSRRSENGLALKTALAGLKRFGIALPSHPGAAQCDERYAQIRPHLSPAGLDALHALGEVADAEAVAAMDLLTAAFVPASFTNEDVAFLVLCEMADQTVAHGMTAASASALAWLGVLVCHRYGANQDGFRYGETAREIVARRSYIAWEARVLLPLDQLSVWTQPLSYAVECARTAFGSGVAHGDITTACYAACHTVANLLVRGDNLAEVRREVCRGLDFVSKAGYRDVEAILELQRAFIDDLSAPEEAAQGYLDIEYRAPNGEQLATYEYWQWIYRATVHFISGRIADAALCLDHAAAFAWSAPAHIHTLDFHFLRALVVASRYGSDDVTAMATLRADAARIRAWANDNADTFADKSALVDAEIARLEGDTTRTMSRYEEAATLARERGFWHVAAMAHERASAHCQSLDLVMAATAHRQFAHEAYLTWGATAKVRQLETLYPALARQPARNWQPAAGTQSFDNESVIRAYHALTEEVRLDQVINKLLTVALEYAGAQHGHLVRMTPDGPVIEASAHTIDSGIAVELQHAPADPTVVPLSLLNTAVRIRQVIRVSEPFGANPFVSDPYFADRANCSAICIPLIRQNEAVGALYLENRLVRDGFTVAHTRVLELIAVQAAISLHTARLYDNLLAENERRRRVEADLRTSEATLAMGEKVSQSGSWRWDLQRDEFTCSTELLRLFELESAEGPIRFDNFLDRMHPEDRDGVKQLVDAAIPRMESLHVDHRLIRKDGSVRYVVAVGKPLQTDGERYDYVGTVTDITERRLAEDAVRGAQAELARVARATTVGQLTASIAHEINQPLMSIVSNAGASLRWLAKTPPNLENAREGIEEIAAAGQRAGAMIRSLQDLTRKNKPVLAPVDLNGTIGQILAIARMEIDRRDVALKLQTMAEAPPTFGDAIQLQQVILNLVLNAVEAMGDVTDRPRVLEISTTAKGPGFIELAVSDNGTGISPDMEDEVFQPFYTTKENGMGMGLSISRSIIEAHGGKLIARRRQPYGSTFSFTIPLQRAADDAPDALAGDLPPIAFR